MTSATTRHATLLFEREIPAPVEKVFAAFADMIARAAWGAPSDTAVVIYDEADFREGGQDRFRCGAQDGFQCSRHDTISGYRRHHIASACGRPQTLRPGGLVIGPPEAAGSFFVVHLGVVLGC